MEDIPVTGDILSALKKFPVYHIRKGGGVVTELLSLKNITKEYPGVRALDDVSISFEKGEVHALIGENGAGKSTVIKTLSGAIRPTSGTIEFEGKTYDHLEPRQAIDLGIAVVYQELIQFEAMNVADNIFMGVEDEVSGLVLNDKQRCEKAKELLEAFDCNIDPRTLVRELSIANRQIIELTKALVRNAKVVVMDEPTAAITIAEQEKLYKLVKQLKERGVTVIYISHRLEELFMICDRVSVLRDGQYVATCNIEDIDKQDMIKLMVGRELTNAYPPKEPATDEVVLDVQNLTGNGVSNVSFQLHKGEILGFAGLVGSGRTELMHLIYGAAKRESGTIRLHGEEINFRSPSDGLKAGVGLIPEDRKFQGCFIDKPIYWNNSVSALNSISRYGVVDRKAEMKMAEEYKTRLKTKAPFLDMVTGGLSGGNQQKVVIAKALAALPDVLIFDEPTRGIDIGARYEIYLACLEARDKMTADDEEIEEALEEGIFVHPAKTFERITGETNVTGVDFMNVKRFFFDENRRAVIEREEESLHHIDCDTVIFATGQRPDITDDAGLTLGRGNSITVVNMENDKSTNVPGIFAAGDCIYGTKSVIQAIQSGREAASQIDKYLGGDGDITEVLAPTEPADPFIGSIEGFADLRRKENKIDCASCRQDNFRLYDHGICDSDIRYEASRCLQCDLRLQISKPHLWADYADKAEGSEK